MEPIYHGQDKLAAIKRARTVPNGIVVYSMKHGEKFGDPKSEFGYWSDENGLVRSWEMVVYPHTDPRFSPHWQPQA